nr:hypothetical protein [Tanacetum cinerariifolium]
MHKGVTAARASITTAGSTLVLLEKVGAATRALKIYSKSNVVPKTVLTMARLVSLHAARPVPIAVTQSTVKSIWLVNHVVNKAHSLVRRPINQRIITKNSNFNKKVTTIKVNKVNVVQGNNGNAEKASAYWV